VTLYTSPEEKQKLARLFEYRKLKPQLLPLLQDAKSLLEAGQKLSVNRSQSYLQLTEQLNNAVSWGHIAEATIASVIADGEVAGNQHILLFELPGTSNRSRRQFFESLSQPSGAEKTAKRMADFLEAPSRSSYEILVQSPDELIVKFVGRREYWDTEILSEETNRVEYAKNRHVERCPVVLKACLSKKLIQLRVSPRSSGSNASGKNHYGYATDVLSSHYAIERDGSWFRSMPPIPIADAFPAIVNSKALLYEMWSDSPEDRAVASRYRNQGRPKLGFDLRDYQHWNHSGGYARKFLSGFFRTSAATAAKGVNRQGTLRFIKLHDEKLTNDQIHHRASRMFLNAYCADEEIEYVIDSIRTHI